MNVYFTSVGLPNADCHDGMVAVAVDADGTLSVCEASATLLDIDHEYSRGRVLPPAGFAYVYARRDHSGGLVLGDDV